MRKVQRKVEGEKLRITFEIAPSGKPEDFKTYLEGTARRVRPKAEGPSD